MSKWKELLEENEKPTKKEREIFDGGLCAGIFLTGLVAVTIMLIHLFIDPIDLVHPNELLNSPEYYIDTITEVIDNDTVTHYEFKYTKDKEK